MRVSGVCNENKINELNYSFYTYTVLLNQGVSYFWELGEAPTISKELQGVSARIGEDATFSCELSQSGLEVKWSKDGKSIRKSQKYEISQEQMLVKLVIRNVTEKDSGEYSCEVTGGPTSKAKLEIKGKVFKSYGFRFCHPFFKHTTGEIPQP